MPLRPRFRPVAYLLGVVRNMSVTVAATVVRHISRSNLAPKQCPQLIAFHDVLIVNYHHGHVIAFRSIRANHIEYSSFIHLYKAMLIKYCLHLDRVRCVFKVKRLAIFFSNFNGRGRKRFFSRC